MGVWDTVGSLGLPHEIDPAHKDRHQLFSFPDCNLGEHIQSAYHALAVNEMRKDFVRSSFFISFNMFEHDIYYRYAPNLFNPMRGEQKDKF